MMREKYLLGTFGNCQRVLCERQLVLPIGLSEELSTSRVKVGPYSLNSYRHIAPAAKKFMCLSRSISILTVHTLAVVFLMCY